MFCVTAKGSKARLHSDPEAKLPGTSRNLTVVLMVHKTDPCYEGKEAYMASEE